MNTEIGPQLVQLLSDLSGHAIGERDYVSYFENEHGEQMVFVREPSATTSQATLLHSDLEWKTDTGHRSSDEWREGS